MVLLLCVTYGLLTVPTSLARPLWHDELFTYYLALHPSLASTLQAVRKIDLNPPLLYLLDFFTLHVPGVLASRHTASLAARLPSLAAGLMGSLALFAWLRRRLGPLYALIGVGLLWNTAFLFYTGEDRPYALLVGITILLMLARDSSLQQRRRPVWLLTMLLLGLALAACHFMAVFVLLAFLGAEGMEIRERRRIDIPLLLSYVLPLGVLVVYHSKISGYESMIFPGAFRPALDTPFITYAVLGYYCWFFFLAGAVIALVPQLGILRARGATSEAAHTKAASYSMSGRERALLLLLLLEPVLAMAAIGRSHGAFFPRYGLPACIPIAIGTACLLHAGLRNFRVATFLTMSLLMAHPIYTVVTNPALLKPGQIAGVHPGAGVPDYHAVETDLPFVDASGLTYVEMNYRESPAFLRRVYYLTNTAAATQYAHATLFEHEEEVREMFHFEAQVEPLRRFEAEHPKFLVLGTFDYPEDWLLRKLKADGDTIRFLGDYATSYKDAGLYEVTLADRGGREPER